MNPKTRDDFKYDLIEFLKIYADLGHRECCKHKKSVANHIAKEWVSNDKEWFKYIKEVLNHSSKEHKSLLCESKILEGTENFLKHKCKGARSDVKIYDSA